MATSPLRAACTRTACTRTAHTRTACTRAACTRTACTRTADTRTACTWHVARSDEEQAAVTKGELHLTQLCLAERNPKSYGAWFHRQWVVDR